LPPSRIACQDGFRLAKQWLAEMLRWQGLSTAQTARTLRVSDITVRRWFNG
jgi:hypothetical protein